VADDLSALAETAKAVETAAQAAGPAADTDFAARVRAWFVEAWTSKFWQNYRLYAAEDMGYYRGGDEAWSFEGSTEDLEKIKAAGRAHLSINHIQAIVDVITGYERQNRYDLKTMPQGDEDSEDAELMTLLLKHEQEQVDAHAYSSECFEDTLIQGLSALEVGVDWTENPAEPRIILEKLVPGEDVLWDPSWTRPDLSDARFVLRFKTAWVEDVVAEYPEHEASIREAVGMLDVAIGEGKLSEWSRTDGYGGTRSHPSESDSILNLFYDSAGGGRVMVIEAQYADYEDVWIVSDTKAGRVFEVDTGEAAREMAAADPKNLTAIRRRKRIIRTGTVLPALYETLEEGDTPYENDDQAYSIIPCIGKRKGEWAYGLVRNLKDPQRAENKRESQLTDLVAKMAILRLVYEENSLVNPAALKDPFSSEPIAMRLGHQPPAYLVPPLGEVVSVLKTLGDRNKMSIREISGINTELLGMETDQASGIAIARRQAQGQVISTVWFDNYRYFRRLLGKRLAKRIQQIYTMERTVRLVGPNGEEMLVTLNPADARELDADSFKKYREERMKIDPRPKILKDVSALKYDVIISEVPTTPTMRATSLLAILEILKVMPGLAPILMDVVIELAEIPDRARILQRVKDMMNPPTPEGGGPELGPGTPKPPGAPVLPPGMAAPTTVGAAGMPLEMAKR